MVSNQSLAPYEKKDQELLLGCHIPFKAPDYLLGSVKEALNDHCSTFMIFLGAPNNTKRVATDLMKGEEGKKLWISKGYQTKNIAVHFPYIVNPASPDEEKAKFALGFIEEELERMERLGLTLMCLHPGSSLTNDRMEQTHVLVNRLRPIFEKHPNIKCSLETMAGKGNELNVGLFEAQMILKEMNLPNFGITLDTCHLWDSGEDFSDSHRLVTKIGETLSFEKVFLIHVNDSKNPRNSSKDRHEKIGEGMIGAKDLLSFIADKRLKDIPKVLETPEYKDKFSHKKEIEKIRMILA